MKIEVLNYKKIETAGDEEPFWSVRIRVEDIFEVSFPVPIVVSENEIVNYLSEHQEDVLGDCKSIYGSVIAHKHNIVDMFLDLREIKKKLKIL